MKDFPDSIRKAVAVLAVICVTLFSYHLAGDKPTRNSDLTASGAIGGQQIAASPLTVSRNSIDFGSVAIGKVALESVTLTNNSENQSVSVDGLFLDDHESPQFSFKQRVPIIIAALQSVEIQITFLPERIEIASGTLIIQTLSGDAKIDLSGAGSGSDEPLVAAANPVGAQAWQTLSSINNPRFESNAVQYRDDIYAFNGFGVGIDVEASVEKYDAGTRKWSVIGKTSQAKGSAVTHNGVIRNGSEVWMLGGRVGDHPGPVTADVWKYDLNSGKWSEGPQLPVPVAAGGAALVNNRIHWFGGLDAKAQCDVSHHYVYDLGNPSAGWKNISSQAPMPVPRNHFATVVYGGLIYAIGGQFTHGGCGAGTPDTDLVHAFNPETNNWTQKASLPDIQSHTEPSTFVHKKAIYVVGGATKGNKVYRYDPAKDVWDTVAVLPQALLAPVARVVDDQLVVSSGGAPSIVPSEVTYVTDMAPLLLTSAGNNNSNSGPDNDNNATNTSSSADSDNTTTTDTDVFADATPSTDAGVVLDNTNPTDSTSFSEPDVNAGLVVLEAEYHDSLSEVDSHQWVTINKNGASNQVAMVTTPDNNTRFQNSNGSPSIGYFAYFDRPGTWYVWLRGSGDTVNGEGSSDSVHVGLNGSLSATADKIDNFPADWNWTNSTIDKVRASLSVPSTGIHAVNLWMREDGLIVDKILLTTDSNYIPSGTGPIPDAANLPVDPQFDVSSESETRVEVSSISHSTSTADTANTDQATTIEVSANDTPDAATTDNALANTGNANNNTLQDIKDTSVESDSGGGALDLLLLLTLISGCVSRFIASVKRCNATGNG